MKRLLLVTFDTDLPRPAGAPAIDLAQVKAAGERVEAALHDLGIEVTNCRIDFGEKAEAILRQALTLGPFDAALIGAGIRTLPEHTELFEMLVNVIHEQAPGTRFAFNASRDSAPEAAVRVLGMA